MNWRPANPARWAILGLADPDRSGRMPDKSTTADVLAHALVLPGAADPVEGIVDAVRVELAALAAMLQERGTGDILLVLARRLEAAMVLLRRSDEREPIPMDDDAVPLASPQDGSIAHAPSALEAPPANDSAPRP